jgi:hypothetical protein
MTNAETSSNDGAQAERAVSPVRRAIFVIPSTFVIWASPFNVDLRRNRDENSAFPID